MTLIAHLTDLHFGTDDPAIVAALHNELVALKPDLVAVSGDLTSGARRSEFRAARAFLDGLGLPVLAVPGNHDITPYAIAERLLDPYRRWREEICMETEPTWRDGRVAVLGLNTARRVGLHWDFSRGRVTQRRLAGLERRLAALPPSLVRIVVAHHPLMPPEGGAHVTVVGGAARALAALARDRVVVVLAGHLHRGYTRVGSADADAPLIVQGSTTTSTRVRGEPNAYNRLDIDADGRPHLSVRVWDGRAWADRAPSPAVLEVNTRDAQ